MTGKISPKDRVHMDRIYKRELGLIKQGQDPETAHAIAVAEETVQIIKDENGTNP